MRNIEKLAAVTKRLENALRLHPELLDEFNQASKKAIAKLKIHAYELETEKLHRKEAVMDEKTKALADEAIHELLVEKIGALVREALKEITSVDNAAEKQKGEFKIGGLDDD